MKKGILITLITILATVLFFGSIIFSEKAAFIEVGIFFLVAAGFACMVIVTDRLIKHFRKKFTVSLKENEITLNMKLPIIEKKNQ